MALSLSFPIATDRNQMLKCLTSEQQLWSYGLQIRFENMMAGLHDHSKVSDLVLGYQLDSGLSKENNNL